VPPPERAQAEGRARDLGEAAAPQAAKQPRSGEWGHPLFFAFPSEVLVHVRDMFSLRCTACLRLVPVGMLACLLATFAACGASNTGACPPVSRPSTGPEPPGPPGPIRHVVLVTVDGLVPDVYLHPEVHGLKTPTLRQMAARGAVASDGVESVFPTLTYPSHTTIVTGVVPGKHGIVSNRTFDPLEEDLEGWRWYAEDIHRDPIWRVAERQGYRTALIHWPVSVGAKVTSLVPEYWRAKDDNDRKLLRAVSTPGLLEEVAREHPDFWSRYLPPASNDDALTDIAIHVLEQTKPSLLLLHLIEVDAAQHHHGLWSPEAREAIEKDDQQLSRIFDALGRTGLAKDTAVVVASDHGFMNAEKMVKPCVLLNGAGLLTARGGRVVEWKAALLAGSGQAYVYLHDPADQETKNRVSTLLTERTRQPDSGIGRIYDSSEIRARGGDPSAFLALEAAPNYQFGGGCTGDYVAPSTYRATHGYDPSRPELHASLLAVGPGIAHGVIRGARLIDIAPTIAGWLGLKMPEVDGKPLRISQTSSTPPAPATSASPSPATSASPSPATSASPSPATSASPAPR
jgi:predicted AlkP superfamily pyrophosphatase or phosphodiesterase